MREEGKGSASGQGEVPFNRIYSPLKLRFHSFSKLNKIPELRIFFSNAQMKHVNHAVKALEAALLQKKRLMGDL